MLEQLLSNIKEPKTTIVGLLVLLSTLPQLEIIQQLMAVSPKIANWITGVATVAGGLVLILGAKVGTKK